MHVRRDLEPRRATTSGTGADALVAGDVDQAAQVVRRRARGRRSRRAPFSSHPGGHRGGRSAVDRRRRPRGGRPRAGGDRSPRAPARRSPARRSASAGTAAASPASPAAPASPPEVLAQIAPEVRAADADLTNALNVLDGVSDRRPPAARCRTRSSRRAASWPRAPSCSAPPTDVAELVPSLLAKGQRYLLIIQNPGEVRGTGGFMGFFGTLESDGTGLRAHQALPHRRHPEGAGGARAGGLRRRATRGSRA